MKMYQQHLFFLRLVFLLLPLVHIALGSDAIEDPGNSKEIGKDFSESRFSMSRSNGENETVFDDILRLNYLSLRAYHLAYSHNKKVPSFEYLVKTGRKNGTLLQEVSEGDMLLDEKDHIVMSKSVREDAEEVKEFEDEAATDDDSSDNDSSDDYGSEVPGPTNADDDIEDTKRTNISHNKPQSERKKARLPLGLTKRKSAPVRSHLSSHRNRSHDWKVNRKRKERSKTTKTRTEEKLAADAGEKGEKRLFDYFNLAQGNRTKLEEEMFPGANIDNTNTTPFGRKLWVSRVVPYYIQHNGTRRWSQAKLENKIIALMNYISAISCVKFRQNRTTDNNYLHIYSGTGCYATIGRKYWIQKGRSLMSLGDWCLQDDIILHLLMHVLGFFHENNRPDRDSFVKVDTSEIIPTMRREFRRHFQYDFTQQHTPYDYRSLMHYGENAYDARPNFDQSYTIAHKFDRNEPLGGDVLTKYNILMINKMYHCGAYYREANVTVSDKGVSPWTEWSISCLNITAQGCTRIRQRQCLDEDLSYCPTVDKFGVEDEFKKCDDRECEVELLVPHWSSWEPITPQCSKTCGRGVWTQTRKCDNPKPPSIGSYTCAGHNHRAGICRVHKCKPVGFDTDFEDGWGTFSNNFQYQTQWKIVRGPSKINVTGALSDHTFGNVEPYKGHYALLAARDPFKHVHQIGELISEPIDTTDGPKCVVFYFLMNGRTVRSLSAFIRLNNKYHKMWTRAGHQGNYWHRGAFTIPQVNVSGGLYVVLDGVTGLAHTSDIAIDDFQLNDGACPVGIEGCYDYFSECKQWRKEGLCITQFDILIFSCCKTCQYEEYRGKDITIGKDYEEG